MEETFFDKDCMSSDLASSNQFTHISNEPKISTPPSVIQHYLKKFNFDNNFTDSNKNPINYLIVGNTRTGKNDLIKNITVKLNSMFTLSKIYLFTIVQLNDYSDIFTNIHFAKDNMDCLTDIIEEIKNNFINNEHSLIILDDTFDIYKNSNKDLFNYLFFNARQLNINIILHTQYPFKFNSNIINSFDNIFVSTHNHSDIKRIYELYLGNIVTSFNHFNNYMNFINSYEFVVITKNNIDNFFTYHKVEPFSSSELLSLSDTKKHQHINLDSNIVKTLDKIKKNNLLIQKLSDENKKLLDTISSP